VTADATHLVSPRRQGRRASSLPPALSRNESPGPCSARKAATTTHRLRARCVAEIGHRQPRPGRQRTMPARTQSGARPRRPRPPFLSPCARPSTNRTPAGRRLSRSLGVAGSWLVSVRCAPVAEGGTTRAMAMAARLGMALREPRLRAGLCQRWRSRRMRTAGSNRVCAVPIGLKPTFS
jgi:hypothetical protein